MSQENVELVKGWIRFRPEPFSGIGGLEQWMREIDEQFQEWQIEVNDWRSTANLVVALGQLHIRGRAGGVEFDQPAAAVVEVSDGRLFRLRLFADGTEALEAAGLRE